MNRRRPITTAAACTVAAALLLSACGGDGDGKKPASGAAPGAARPAKDSPDAPAPGPQRPDIGLGGGHKVTFDFARPADPGEAAALADSSRFVQAIWHGILAQDANDPAYRFYSRKDATAFGKSRIEAELKGGWTPSGTDRYYNASTVAGDAKSVRVTFCHDGSKAFSKAKKTGKRRTAKPNPDNFQKYSVLMRPSPALPQGWVAEQVQVQERATAECRVTKSSEAKKRPARSTPPAGHRKENPPRKSDSGSGSKTKKPRTSRH
ncbi:hypothetical protein OG897_26320 [Streptomyces sp. NBC_00237]|uniref:hypothetical protein n=1 Tax=Streptomyces sp. NBC_00237 TaxID=2975687 RepID=UPI00224E2900|nr:hypothetical protein [Streptomyces sp. NBC_00237]MCX5204958.1 hypothetical protein [Streptomyces sp. NBC_00237]